MKAASSYVSLRESWKRVCQHLQVDRCLLRREFREGLGERSEIHPLEPLFLITLGSDGRRSLEVAQWGLLPSDEEGVETGRDRIFLPYEQFDRMQVGISRFSPNRCLIPVTAVSLPAKRRNGKASFEVGRRNAGLLSVAGIWTRWFAPTGASLLTCAMLTVKLPHVLGAPCCFAPLVLTPGSETAWLKGDFPPLDRAEDSCPIPFQDLVIQPLVEQAPRADGAQGLPSLLMPLHPIAATATRTEASSHNRLVVRPGMPGTIPRRIRFPGGGGRETVSSRPA